MTLVSFMFTDSVDGREVNHYVDYKGRHWMTTDKWAYFRVPLNVMQPELPPLRLVYSRSKEKKNEAL